jgi:hypothetical protein
VSLLEIQWEKLAYNAYRDAAGGVSLVTGEKLPEFEELAPKIQAAWKASALAVSGRCLNECFRHLARGAGLVLDLD